MTREPDPILDVMPALRRYAVALSRDEAEADDLVQEALLRGHDYAVPFLLLYVFGFGMMVVVGLAQGRAGGWSHTLRRRTRASGTRPQVGYREV